MNVLIGAEYCREYVLRSEQKPRHELKAEIDAYLAEYDNKVEEVCNKSTHESLL